MVTALHIWPDTKSRWIEITDGSIYDNLGLQSLLRRQVSRVIVGDATLDNTWQFDYLQNLQESIKGNLAEGAEWCGEILEKSEIVWYRRFWVKRPDDTPMVTHDLKPYAYNAVLFKRNPSLAAPGKIFFSADPEMCRSMDSAHSPVPQPTRHTWMQTGSCR